MQRITSSQNPRFKNACRLRSSRARKRTGLTLVDGMRELNLALDAHVEIVELFVSECCESPEIELLRARATEAGADLIELSSRLFDQVAFGDRLEGAVGVARVPRPTVEQIRLSANSLLVVLDDIEKPGNLGAIVRTADAVAADAVIVSNPRTDPFHPNAIRASLGTVFTIPIAEANRTQTIEWLRSHSCNVFVTRVDADRVYSDACFSRGAAIVLGNESHGLSEEWNQPDFQGVRLPMLGAADSLNVSITGAILLFEARRQRQFRRSKRTANTPPTEE